MKRGSSGDKVGGDQGEAAEEEGSPAVLGLLPAATKVRIALPPFMVCRASVGRLMTTGYRVAVRASPRTLYPFFLTPNAARAGALP